MESWAAVGQKGTGKGGAAKKRKTAHESEASLTQVVADIGRLSLETSRTVRQHSGALMHTCLIPLHEAFNAAVSQTAAATGTDPSMDYAQTWAALVLSLAALTFDDANTASAVQTLAAHAGQVSSPAAMRGILHFCRVAITHDKAKVKVQLWGEPSLLPVFSAVQAISVKLGGEVCFGAPPRSALERAAARSMAAAGFSRQG
jgi:hypothetical protein